MIDQKQILHEPFTKQCHIHGSEREGEHQMFVLPLTTHINTHGRVCIHKMIRKNFWNYSAIHIQQCISIIIMEMGRWWWMMTIRIVYLVCWHNGNNFKLIILNFNKNANILSFLSRLSFLIQLYYNLLTTSVLKDT